MPVLFRRVTDAVYWTCVVVSCIALVLISAVVPWAVYTRKVLNSAASWPEPLAVLLTVLVTFLGAAACYRQGLHMNMTVGTDRLPVSLRRAAAVASELLMGAMSVFMVVWGLRLVATTWQNSVDEFPWLSVGITYLPIPIGGFAMALFVAEKLTIGSPPKSRHDEEPAVSFD